MLKNVESIKKLGYKVIVSNASNLNEILELISVVGVISGRKNEAEDLRKVSSLKLEKIIKENDASKVVNISKKEKEI